MERPAILVVDDDPDFAASLGELIRMQDCDVSFASDGLEALAQYGQYVFDLVILDKKMHGMGGIECFRELRKKHPDAQVAMITGHYDEHELREARNRGLYGVLEKPVDIDRLNRILETIKLSPVILVAEDDAICSYAVSRMLTDQGYRVRKAKNGRQAIDKIRQCDINLMILDLCMPVMNGREVCEELHATGCLPPTILTTAYPDSELMRMEKNTALSIPECMIKPIKPEQLYKVVDNMLNTGRGCPHE